MNQTRQNPVREPGGREQNFVSAVVYLQGGEARILRFFKTLAEQLETHFAQYELVAVDDAADPAAVAALRRWERNPRAASRSGGTRRSRPDALAEQER